MRAGRISASNLKAVCHTDTAMPSISLIMSICHPDMSHFNTTATAYGRVYVCMCVYVLQDPCGGVCEIKVCKSSSLRTRFAKLGKNQNLAVYF